MAQKLYEEANIQDIANAIRSQNGTHDAYTVAQMGNAVRAIHTQPNLETLNVTENGNYLPNSGKDGFSSVTVNVSSSEAVVQPLSVNENGTYNPPSGVDGFAPVTVNVSSEEAVVQPLSVTQNGTYNPPSGVDGFAPVTVNVEGSGGPAKTAMLKVGQTHSIVPATNTIYSITNGAADYLVPVGENKSEVKLDLSQPFEICCKFKIANSPGNTGRNIWGSINSYYYCPAMAVKSTQAEYYVTTNGYSWQHSGIAITPNGWTCPLDTWMIAKLSWDGSDFAFYFYDGTNEYSATLQNVTPYYNSDYSFCFGSQNKHATYCIAACDASIDLAGTYLKQNNTKIWETTSSDGCSSTTFYSYSLFLPENLTNSGWTDPSSGKSITLNTGTWQVEDGKLVADGSYYSFDIPDSDCLIQCVLTIDPNFTPLAQSDWWKQSTLFGTELASYQNDLCATIVEDNGILYPSIGAGRSGYTQGTISINKGDEHVIALAHIATKYFLYVDGALSVSFEYKPSGTRLSSMGLFWNKDSSSTAVIGTISKLGVWTTVPTTAPVLPSFDGEDSSSEAVVQPLSVNENGTYNPPSGVDGFAPVTVNVEGSNERGLIADWDFTKSLIDSINEITATLNKGATQDSDGVHLNSEIHYISIPYNVKALARTYELDIGAMSLYSGTNHNRFFMWSVSDGLIYRSTGRWSFYSNNKWSTDSNILDFDYFANSTIKILVDVTGYVHIYKNNVLVYEPDVKFVNSSGDLYIGSTSFSANSVDIKALRVIDSSKSVVVQPLSVTQNGTYNPPSGVDGYTPVTVNVEGGGDNELINELVAKTFIAFSQTSSKDLDTYIAGIDSYDFNSNETIRRSRTPEQIQNLTLSDILGLLQSENNIILEYFTNTSDDPTARSMFENLKQNLHAVNLGRISGTGVLTDSINNYSYIMIASCYTSSGYTAYDVSMIYKPLELGVWYAIGMKDRNPSYRTYVKFGENNSVIVKQSKDDSGSNTSAVIYGIP